MYCITGMNTEDAGCRHTNGTFKVQTTRRSYIPAPSTIRRSLLKIVPITGFQRWDPVLEIYFCPSPGSCEFLQINQLTICCVKHHSPIVGKGICLVQIAMLRNRCELWCPLYRVFCLFRDLEIILKAAQTHHRSELHNN